MPAYRVVLLFEGVPDRETLNGLVWKMRQAGRDHAGVAMPTYEKAWVAKNDSFGQPLGNPAGNGCPKCRSGAKHTTHYREPSAPKAEVKRDG